MSSFLHMPSGPVNSAPRRGAESQPSRLAAPADRHEREADAAAKRAMAPGAPEAATAQAPAPAPAAGSGGRPLDPEVRAYFEPRLGADFSGVRVHDGGHAAALADGLGAKAFTRGSDITFGAGRFKPQTDEGGRLLAHELAHVVQQGRMGANDARPPIQFDLMDVVEKGPLPTVDALNDLLKPSMWEMNSMESRIRVVGRVLAKAFREGNFKYVEAAIDEIDSSLEDNVGAAALSRLSDAELDTIAATSAGRHALNIVYEAVITGDVSEFERTHANRALFAGARATNTPDQYARKVSRRSDGRAVPTFPVRFMRVTGGDYAPPEAKLLPSGKVWVKYPVRVMYMDMFKREVSTLPGGAFVGGLELDPDEIINIKLYEEGGRTVSLPALALIDYSNQAIQSTSGKIIEVSVIAATLGWGAGASAASKATSGLARFVQIANKVAEIVPIVSLLVGENRDWIIDRFGVAGKILVRTTEIADTVVKIYGVTRLAHSMAKGGWGFIKSVRNAMKDVREDAAAVRQLTAGQSGVLDKIDDGMDGLVKQLDEAGDAGGATAKSATPGAAPETPAGGGGSAPSAPATPTTTPKPGPKVEMRTPKTMDYGVPEASASPGAKPPLETTTPHPKPAGEAMRPKAGEGPIGGATTTPTGARTFKPPAKAPVVEVRKPGTPDLGEPNASATPRSSSPTKPMKNLPKGEAHGPTSTGPSGAPVSSPKSTIVSETRKPGSPGFGKPEGSATPGSVGPDPWQASQKPARPATPRGPPGHIQDTAQAAKDAEAQGLGKLGKGHVPMQEHRAASAVRAATPSNVVNPNSTHFVPQDVYKQLGKSPDLAPTANLPRSVNNAIDGAWVPEWQEAKRLGKEFTGRQLREGVTKGIRGVPDTMLDKATRNTLEWAFQIEMRNLGITDNTVILPAIN